MQRAWRDAGQGHFYFHAQIGHPLGVPDFAYPGEVALGVILADPSGELTDLQRLAGDYPPRLRDAVVHRCLWEASFLIDIAGKAVAREDTTYLAGCLFRAIGMCAHTLHGHAGRWLINEKGAIASAAQLPAAPADFASRAHGLLAQLGTRPAQLTAALDAATALLHDTTDACQHHP